MLLGTMSTTILVCLTVATCLTGVAASTREVLDDHKRTCRAGDTQKNDGDRCKYFNEPDVQSMSLRVPETKIPTDMTTYLCHVLDLPADKDYHLIGAEFELDNTEVVHHMALMGCSTPMKASSEMYQCSKGINSNKCPILLTFFNRGLKEPCLVPEAGIPFGKGSRTSALMVIHYTNENGVEGHRDSSGFKIYYTAKLRPYNAGVLFLGQTGLEIPPGRQNVLQRGTCTSKCSRRIFKGPFLVTDAINHMHLLGRNENVTLLRSNQPPMVLLNDEHYSYADPKMCRYDPPVTIQPGDEIQVNCHYDSTSRDSITRYGKSSYDEMCYIYMYYYPEENVHNDLKTIFPKSCIQLQSVDLC